MKNNMPNLNQRNSARVLNTTATSLDLELGPDDR